MLAFRLFHGRRKATDVLDGWGADGPVLGPLESVHVTYGGFTLALPNDEMVELMLIDGLLHYDGMLYGDAELVQSLEPDAIPTQALATPKQSLSRRRDERSSVGLPPHVLAEYRRRLQVFTDSIRELAGDHAAESVSRALSNVVRRERRPGRRSSPPIATTSSKATRRRTED